MRVFIDGELRADMVLELPAAAARHVQVRRLQPGDPLRLFNGQGGEWAATVQRMGRTQVVVQLGAFDPVEREMALPVTVALGMPANERMDFLVEKATELGVHAIQPLLCERSVLRLSGERAQRKCEHWQAIAVAAAEQCGRTRVPAVRPVRTLGAFLAEPMPAAPRLLLSLGAAAPALHDVVGAEAKCLLTLSGPEGGLSAAEEHAAVAQGFQRVHLGARILRAETAPLALLAWLGLRG